MRRFPIPLAALALLSAAPAVAGEPQEEARFKELREHGIELARRKLWEPARSELEEALAAPGGAQDASTHYWMARVCRELLFLDSAFPYAERAVKLAGEGGKDAKRAAGLLADLRKYFGGVTLTKDERASRQAGYLHLEADPPLIKPEKKKQFANLKELYESREFELPVTLYLPFGRFTVNGIPFETKAGETAKIAIFPDGPPFSWTPVVIGASVAAAAAGAGLVYLLTREEAEPEYVLAAPAAVEH